MQKKIDLSPKIAKMISSLKSSGYSFESAVSDIIDNSIDAGSKKIDIIFDFENYKLTISDDGLGMNYEELKNGMVLGSESLKGIESLGKFGMGLTTSSISQANFVKVISKKNGVTNSIFYNVDECIKKDEWFGIKSNDVIDFKRGTVVEWSDFHKLKEIVEKKETIIILLSKLEKHISKTFYMFIRDGIKITLNGNIIPSKSPFYEEYNSQITSETEEIKGSKIKFTGYNILNSKIEEEQLLENQGIYIFRNNRLIQQIRWAGIFEIHQRLNYLRIKLEISPELDDFFELDFKKGNIIIPVEVKKITKQFIKSYQNANRNKNKIRQVRKNKTKIEPESIWKINKKDVILNVDNLYIKSFMNKNEIEESEIIKFSKMILTNIDLYELQNKTKQMDEEEMYEQILCEAQYFLEMGVPLNDVIEQLFYSHPFANFPDLISQIKKELENADK